MEFLLMDDEKDIQVESALHSNIPSYEKEDDQPSVVQEECYNLFYEECNQLVTNFSCVGFEEDSNPPIYDEYEDGYLDNAPKEPAVCSKGLDHLKEDEGPKWDVSSCSSNSKFPCQEEFISLDFVEGEDDISGEAHKENLVVTS